MALIPVFYTASTKDIAEKSHEQGILKYPGICWIQDIETIVYVSSDNELHYAKGNEQIDKVIGAVSGHLPTLNDDGSLVDSGKSVNDFETAGAAASVLADAKSYINKKISELINGAPETADTLKELSDLVSQNKDVITSLDTLVSKKADITAIPTTLPNPNALTFSGLIEGNYDGSEAVNIEVPQDMWIHVTTDSSNSLNSDVTFKEIENYYKSHPSNNIFICYKKDNAEFKGILETAYLGREYEFGVWDLSLDYKIIKTVITINQDDNISTTVVPSNISTVGTNRNTTFEKAVCELLVYNDCGIVDDAYNGDTYLVIKTHFDRGYGTCIISSSDTGFKAYTYNLRDMTIAPYTPNIISITIGGNGKYKSSYNFNTIKKINPENMLVCYNDAYGRLVSMDDNKVVFNIPKYVDNHLSIYMTIITINSDNSVEVIMEVPFARLLKNDNDAYVLDLSDTFMGDQFDIVYIDDAIKSSYLGKMYKETDDGTIFRIWLSETEIMDVTVNSNEINGATDLSAVPVTVEKKSIVPAALPNPNKLTLSGLVSAEYDGSSDVSVEIPESYPCFTVGSDAEFAKDVCIITQSYTFGFIYDSRFDSLYTVIKINFSRGTGSAYVSDRNSGFVKYFTNSQTNTIEKSTDVIKNPNPNKLILTGGAEAEYDGTSEVTVDIPEPIIFDVRAVSDGGGISSHLETDATYNELYTIAQSTPHIYARYLRKLYPLFKVENLLSPNTLEFVGIDTKIVIDANNSITEENNVYDSALRVTVIKKNSVYTVQDVTSEDFFNRYSRNFVFITLDNQDVDPQTVQVFQVNLTDFKMGEVNYFEYTYMNYNIIIKFTFKIDEENIDNPPTVTVEQKPIVPAALPNPNKLTFEGAVTAEYDGSSEVSVDIPNDYDSLENKPIVSINDLLNLDNEHFMCLDGKVNDKGMIPYRTYKFIVDPSLDLNNKLIVVTSDNNIKSMSLAVMAKDSAETTKVYAAIFNLGIGELIAISTDKIHKTATVCRLSVGYRISLMFNDDGYVERTVVSSVANKSDVLTKTNKTEFIPTEDYHPATKKYVDDTCGEHSPTVRIEKTAADTTAEIEPNKLYVFPEMASLTYTLVAPADTSVANEYHFVFRSGATATELVHPANVSVPDGFAVEKNKVYEISILEGCMAYQSWAVN